MKPKHKTNNKENILFLRELGNRLNRGGMVSADFEAEMLVRHFGRMSRVELFAGDKILSSAARKRIQQAAAERLKGRPLQYLLGETDFLGHRFLVNEDVLIPRPETELLAERALEIVRPLKAPRILDLGTGSGCIAVSLTLARSDCRMTALDISKKALGVARKNAALHGVGRKLKFVQSDLFGAFGGDKKNFWDLIVSNPPYVPKEDFAGLSKEVLAEPRLALDGGPGGYDTLFRLLKQAPFFLKKKGWLLVEIGRGQSGRLARVMAKEKMFSSFKFIEDYSGIKRILAAQNG